MEKTTLGTVLILNAGWDDIGNWKSVWKNSKKDKEGNISKGSIILEDSKIVTLEAKTDLLLE